MMGNYHVRFGEQLQCALPLLFFMVKCYWPKIITLSYINFSILINPLKTDMKNEVIKNKSIGSNYNKRFKSSS